MATRAARTGRLLIVVASRVEGDALRDVLPATAELVVSGVGPAAAAAATAAALCRPPASEDEPAPTAVVCAGIAGGFGEAAEPGTLVLAERMIAADLGAASPGGFIPLDELGMGQTTLDGDPTLTASLVETLTGAGLAPRLGDVLTVSTVTGTREHAAELSRRHPRALAEAMEGYGVAVAAAARGVPMTELRSVSNAVGPRDRAAWRIPDALAALRAALTALADHRWPVRPR